MRQVASALAALTWLFFCTSAPVRAQMQGGRVAIGFVNMTGTPVVVRAFSVVGGRQTPTTALIVPKGGTLAYELGVPANAIRYYTIHDATQLNRILLGPIPVPVHVQMRPLFFRVVPSPIDPKKAIIQPFIP